MRRLAFWGAISAVLAGGSAWAADLGVPEPITTPDGVSTSGWTLQFTTYGWVPWLTGEAKIAGRSFDVDVGPQDIFKNLDWSQIPAWMSYMEARNGRLSLFNDIVYSKIAGSADFAKTVTRRVATLTLGGEIEADYEQATVEAGAAYEVWSSGSHGSAGVTAIDVLAGIRYWHQEASLSANVNATLSIEGPRGLIGLSRSGNRVFAKSGSVDWVDPIVGARLRHQVAPGQELVLRGDIGGFGAGSDFSWQAIGTYNWQMCTVGSLVLNGYAGYRALQVDYEQGSGLKEYKYDVLQHGPVFGLTTNF